MACTPAQLEANRLNAQKSTGPRTQEGKERSRRNGLKHGLTGRGIVLHEDDAEEVARRFEAFEADLAPGSEPARVLVAHAALMSVRMERCGEHEARAISHRMRHAVADFDDARLAEVEKAYSWLAAEPATHARRLRTMPEGIDRLIGALLKLRSELAGADGIRWGWDYCDQLHHLMGERRMEVPVSRVRALGDAIGGDFQHLRPSDGADLSPVERQRWAGEQLVELIDAEVARLEGIRGGLDLATLELDRLEAPARAMFDGSKDAVLARKYEAAAVRGLYRALKELRAVQAELAQVVAGPGPEPKPGAESASSLPDAPGPEDDEVKVDPIVPTARPKLASRADRRPRGRAKARFRPDRKADGRPGRGS